MHWSPLWQLANTRVEHSEAGPSAAGGAAGGQDLQVAVDDIRGFAEPHEATLPTSSSQLDSSPTPRSKRKKTPVSTSGEWKKTKQGETTEVVSGREQKQTVSPPPKLQSDAPASAGARPAGDAAHW